MFESTKGRQYALSFFSRLATMIDNIHLHQFINSLNTESFYCVTLITFEKNPKNYKPPSNSTPSTLIFNVINMIIGAVRDIFYNSSKEVKITN